MAECARPRGERSGFKPWPGTLCCDLTQDTCTLLSLCLSPPMAKCNLMLKVTLPWTSIPTKGEQKHS